MALGVESLAAEGEGILGRFSRSSLLAAGAGIAGAAFIGYCIYFDHKRRSDPEFKQKLRARRLAARRSQGGGAGGGSASGGSKSGMPSADDLANPTAMQQFFVQEVQLGEEMLNEGRIEEGVEHLANGVAVCSQPQQLLAIFRQTMPAEINALLAMKIPQAQQRMLQVINEARKKQGGKINLLDDQGDSKEDDETQDDDDDGTFKRMDDHELE